MRGHCNNLLKPTIGDNGLDSSKTCANLKKYNCSYGYNEAVRQVRFQLPLGLPIFLMIPKLEYGSTLNCLVKPSQDENNLKVNNH